MNKSHAPPTLKSIYGIDSVHLRLRDVNRYDINGFCKEYNLVSKERKSTRYVKRWFIFLAGGQTITATYHHSSRTTTLEVGGLMEYSINASTRHHFVQNIMRHFMDKDIRVSRIDIAVDINIPWRKLPVDKLSSNLKVVGSTIYYNKPAKTVFVVYDKAKHLEIFSTPLMRLELRINDQINNWKVDDFIANKRSFEKLVSKIEVMLTRAIEIWQQYVKLNFLWEIDFQTMLHDFIAFLHGAKYNPFQKDPFRIRQAIKNRDALFDWMRSHGLKSIKNVREYMKGRKAACLKEIGLSDKTLKKALAFYDAIPNFKIP